MDVYFVLVLFYFSVRYESRFPDHYQVRVGSAGGAWQFAFDKACPIAGTAGKNIVIEIIPVAMQHRPIFGRTGPKPDIGPRLFRKHIGKIFGPHRWGQVGDNIIRPKHLSGNRRSAAGLNRVIAVGG